MSWWQPLLVGLSAATVVLTAAARYLRALSKVIRTFLGLIHTVKELAEMMHAHNEHHHHRDPKETKALDEIIRRMDRLENEMRDIRTMMPHFRAATVPAQESNKA